MLPVLLHKQGIIMLPHAHSVSGPFMVYGLDRKASMTKSSEAVPSSLSARLIQLVELALRHETPQARAIVALGTGTFLAAAVYEISNNPLLLIGVGALAVYLLRPKSGCITRVNESLLINQPCPHNTFSKGKNHG